ncbi:MAG TPA: DUF1559 domain-containing protein [Pirellulales bacterium]|jgi:type II secretory pathway pseudopilin PulG|nr:DUF1559 domain-containing protein [Pirellulales bacterium]
MSQRLLLAVVTRNRPHANCFGGSSGGFRRGVSIVELLVVTGIIGLLASLTFSAVQQSRESARRLQCLGHLKQLGQATASFESSNGAIPETTAGHNGLGRRWQSISPHVHLLPFLDQSQLYSQVDFAERGIGPTSDPPKSTWNPELLKITVPVFRCPSDGQQWPGANNYRANMGGGPAVLKHVVNGVADEPANGSGPFRIWHGTRPAEISDGLSNTALFSERLVGGLRPSWFIGPRDYFFSQTGPIETIADAEAACWLPAGANPAHDAYSGTTWLMGGFRHTWYNHIRTPNSVFPDCGPQKGAFTARSAHPGGVNIVLADGAGRFITSNIELAVWRAIATRAGTDALSGEF